MASHGGRQELHERSASPCERPIRAGERRQRVLRLAMADGVHNEIGRTLVAPERPFIRRNRLLDEFLFN
jgi:hypothetical protein